MGHTIVSNVRLPTSEVNSSDMYDGASAREATRLVVDTFNTRGVLTLQIHKRLTRHPDAVKGE